MVKAYVCLVVRNGRTCVYPTPYTQETSSEDVQLEHKHGMRTNTCMRERSCFGNSTVSYTDDSIVKFFGPWQRGKEGCK